MGTKNRLVLTLNGTVLAFIQACSRFIATCSNYLKMKTSPLGYIGSPALSIFSRNSVALAGSSVLLNKALTSAVLASNKGSAHETKKFYRDFPRSQGTVGMVFLEDSFLVPDAN